MFWDYLSQNPESLHQVMILFGDRGVPDGYRKMHGYSGHTFKMVNKDGDWVYCQIHLISQQGTGFLEQSKAGELAGSTPDYATVRAQNFHQSQVCAYPFFPFSAERSL